jgi:ABC-2 type transport system permease protein
MPNPIADLSYRNYDGPLEPPIYRWWSIARASMQLNLKKKFFWILAVLSGYWYVLMMAVFYFIESLTQGQALGGKNQVFSRIVWKDQFINAFSISQLMLFLVALVIGTGAIANDNRANALLVYLSKPVSRLDYLIGKWVGIFIPITMATAIPTLFFYAYCFMSYRDYGFVTEDPRLILRLLGMILLPGIFHSSVALGISSLFDQGRLAGATYAGLYFMSLSFTKVMQFTYGAGRGGPSAVVGNLYYCSVDGIQIALAKIILGTDGSGLFSGLGNGPKGGAPLIPAPSAGPFFAAFIGICALAVFVAWSRIRAVEVVG